MVSGGNLCMPAMTLRSLPNSNGMCRGGMLLSAPPLHGMLLRASPLYMAKLSQEFESILMERELKSFTAKRDIWMPFRVLLHCS